MNNEDILLLLLHKGCDEIFRGKPCSSFILNKRYVESVKKVLKNYPKIKYDLHEYYPNWFELMVWQYDHIGKMVEFIKTNTFKRLDQDVQDWIQGKMFGYSEEAIKEYCEQRDDDESDN